MANSLNTDLTGKTVVLKGVAMLKDRLFFCASGFGCYNYTSGSKIFGRFADGREGAVDGYAVDRLATDEDLKGVNRRFQRE